MRNTFQVLAQSAMKITDFIDAYKKGTFGVTMITSTEPTMRKTNNPFVGRVRKVTILKNVAIGYSYETYVNARGLREGIEGEFKFKTMPLPYGSWVEGYEGVLLENKGKEYVRVTMLPNTSVNVTMMVDGRPARAEEVEAIKSFIPTPKPSARQAEYGLKEEVIVRNYSVDNILTLSQGHIKYEKDIPYGLGL